MGLAATLISLILPTLAISQVPPGGGGGGWTIDYQLNGTTILDTAPPASHSENPWDTDPSQWRSSCTIMGVTNLIKSQGASASGSMSGTVTVRVRWTGSGTAPNHVWLMLDSFASWKGDSGNCSNGQNDPKATISPGPGETATGKHILRKAYSGQPITFDVALSASMSCSTFTKPYMMGVGLSVSVTDRSATLARGDGGTATLTGDTYTGHTLLSWSGTHDGLNYDNLPDGGPGLTSQTLTGTAAGAWSTKQFTNPQTQQPYTTADLTIAWGGSTAGAVSLTPPNPLTVLATTYQGNMPQFDPEGTTPKEETWTYKVKDNQDGSLIDLKWKWIAHYAHENWEPVVPDPNDPRPETSVIVGPAIWTRALSAENIDAYGSVQGGSMNVTTDYSGGTPQGIPGFSIEKHHIGITAIRAVFGMTSARPYAGQNVELQYDPLFGPGNYSIHPIARAPIQRGYATVWNKKGQSGLAAMRFVSCLSYEVELEQRAPGEGGM